MKFAQSAFMPICWVAAILSMVFVAQIVTAGRPSSSGVAVAQPSVPVAPMAINNNLIYEALPSGSIACSLPFNLKEAGYAQDDAKWLKSLGCIRLKTAIPAKRLEGTSFGVKVRMTLPDGDGITVWTDFSPVDHCGDIPCPPPPEHGSLSKPLKPDVKRETGTSARWVCQKTTIVNRDGSSPTTCGFQTLPEDAK